MVSEHKNRDDILTQPLSGGATSVKPSTSKQVNSSAF